MELFQSQGILQINSMICLFGFWSLVITMNLKVKKCVTFQVYLLPLYSILRYQFALILATQQQMVLHDIVNMSAGSESNSTRERMRGIFDNL